MRGDPAAKGSEMAEKSKILTRADLTKRQLQILRKMRDEDEELVYEGRCCYVGLERTSSATVTALLRACALRADQFNKGKVERYTINETGREILSEGGY